MERVMSNKDEDATIVIVDDEEMVLTSITSLLELETRYQVKSFTLPRNALEFVRAEAMDGSDSCTRFRPPYSPRQTRDLTVDCTSSREREASTTQAPCPLQSRSQISRLRARTELARSSTLRATASSGSRRSTTAQSGGVIVS